ncbi:MAG TPA: hypothetical protein VMM80_09390 [Bacteroidota bacterium]|nr:hypothetical protein [Bacteroidota bacterium]
MTTGQTILTIAAFILLTTILQGVYASIGRTGQDISGGQDGILATTIATSYTEFANGLAFDQVTDTSDIALTTPLSLTYPPGPESGETTIDTFNDFDDLNGYSEEKTAGGSDRRYMTTFTVSYADTNDISKSVSYRTYLKRLDMKTWRTYPATGSDEILDTLKTSIVMGYFHFY